MVMYSLGLSICIRLIRELMFLRSSFWDVSLANDIYIMFYMHIHYTRIYIYKCCLYRRMRMMVGITHTLFIVSCTLWSLVQAVIVGNCYLDSRSYFRLYVPLCFNDFNNSFFWNICWLQIASINCAESVSDFFNSVYFQFIGNFKCSLNVTILQMH